MLVLKIMLTIILAAILVYGVPFTISEIKEFKNWPRLVVFLTAYIAAVLDIYILWFA